MAMTPCSSIQPSNNQSQITNHYLCPSVPHLWLTLLPLASLCVLRQLLDDRGHVEPDLLALDLAVAGELDDVEDAKLERPVAALEPERAAGRPALPHRLVDHELRAVQPPDHAH